MGDRLRVKVVSAVALVAVAGTALVIACGSDEATIDSPCEGTACDGGSESSTADGPNQEDGNTKDGRADALADADADSSVVANCGDGGPPGTLDETFGDGGMVWLKYAGAQGTAIAVQADGKILVGGKTQQGTGAGFAVVRLLQDGSLDATFGSGGLVEKKVATSTHVLSALAVQTDGRIVGAGFARSSGQRTQLAVLRLLSDGGSDTSFGDGGVVLNGESGRDVMGQALVVLPSGKLLVAGYSEDAFNPDGSQNYEVARYNADGSLDATFGTAGRVTIDVRGTSDMSGVAATLGAKVVVGGGSALTTSLSSSYDVSAVRLNADGTTDTSFADAGTLVLAGIGKPFNSPGRSIAVDGSGNTLLAGSFRLGSSGDDFGACRVSGAGVLDPTFGDGGVISTDFGARGDGAAAILVEPGGKIILIGGSTLGTGTASIAAARYLANGTLDTAFGTNGLVLTPPPANADLTASAAALQGCGVVAVGTWLYDENTLTKNAMGIVRYRR